MIVNVDIIVAVTLAEFVVSDNLAYSFTSNPITNVNEGQQMFEIFCFTTVMFTSFTGSHDYCIGLIHCPKLCIKTQKYKFFADRAECCRLFLKRQSVL